MRVAGIPYVQGRNDYRDGDRSKYGIAIHNTSNNASDDGEAGYATRRPDGTSAHFYADADSVTQSIDTRDRAGHAGSTHGNDHGIAVEITGANGWSREKWLRSVAWDKLGAVLAKVIRHHWPDGSFQVRRATVAEMRRNPRVKALYGHDDMRRAWGGTDHTDPGPNFPWDRLLSAIRVALNPPPAAPEDDMPALDEIVDALKKELPGAVWAAEYGKEDRRYKVLDRLAEVRGAALAAAAAGQEARLRDEALLAAVRGDDNDEILARIDTRAAEQAQRDAVAAQERAAILALVQQSQDGTLDAAAVVARIGDLLTRDTPATD